MNIFQFCWSALAWTVSIVALWPITAGLAAGAFRIGKGTTPLDDDEKSELWWRSLLGTLAMAVGAVALVLVDYGLVQWAELPSGPVHLVTFLAVIAFCIWMLVLFFALEDFFAGLSMFLIFAYLPMFVLWLFNKVTGLWNSPLQLVLDWLKEPPAT